MRAILATTVLGILALSMIARWRPMLAAGILAGICFLGALGALLGWFIARPNRPRVGPRRTSGPPAPGREDRP